MKVTYIFHSGFLMETPQSYYIFDYYKGALPPLRPDKPAVVFSSHGHGDHYNPEIFQMLKDMGMQHILGVLSKDIPTKKYPADTQIIKVHGRREYALPGGESLETLISTDEGVAFVLDTGFGVIYHAGDLNDWTWEGESDSSNRQMRGSYRSHIDSLKGKTIDYAFLPLDPRQEKHYADGMAYFLSVVSPRAVFPMHYWQQPDVINRFLSEYPQYKGIVNNTEEYLGGTTCSSLK